MSRRALISGLGAGIAFAGSGCAPNVSGAPRVTVGTPAVNSVPGAQYPAGWQPKMLERTLQEFIAAFNDGDQATLSRFIPATSGTLNDWTPDRLFGFVVFGEGAPTGGGQVNKDKVLALLAAGHARGEHWRLSDVSVASTASPETLVYQMLIERTQRGGSASLGLGAGLLYAPQRTIPAWVLLPAPAGLARLSPPFMNDSTALPTVSKAAETFDEPLPSGCDVPALIAAVQRLFTAFNSGDEDVLRGFIPPAGSSERGFHWYDVSGTFSPSGSEFVGRTQDDVIAYFADRHRHHEQLRLLAMSQVNWDSRTGAMGFTPAIARWADDVAPHVASGKMAMYCPGFQIQVWVQNLAPPMLPKLPSG